MALKPWYKVVNPRKDLREGKSLVVAEFAVHLDQIRDNKGYEEYRIPERFFENTYLTDGLIATASEVLRRLSGDDTQNAVFNMATQFGGGKTHSLALFYHLATNGPNANAFVGVQKILERSGLSSVPKAATAVFVGTEFDSISGRSRDGEPLRKTPWGEIAFQLAGEEGFQIVREQDEELLAPGGDVIRAFMPKDRPCLILMDELMNYASGYRKLGLSAQLYRFIQNLSEVVRGLSNVVVVISIPASQLEMTAEDVLDYDRFKKVLDRVSKPIMISSDADISEIIRRRLFEWDKDHLTAEGKVVLDKEAIKTCKAYAEWVKENRLQIPAWFDADHAEEAFKATYPFHPMTISVFRRKWQTLPRFQRTRGVLRLLGLWASRAFREGWTGAHHDPLICLGTAPLEERDFRAAALEQLGEQLLEVPITTDIVGSAEAHALRLDSQAIDTIKRARLHRKVATAIFFESNGGMTKNEEATLPEVRLAVAQPDLDIGNVETVVESLKKTCYYINERGTKFGVRPGINKLFADGQAAVEGPEINERAHQAVLEVFNKGKGLKPIPFPEKSNEIPDQPALNLAVLSLEHTMRETTTLSLVESMTKDHGSSARFYKSALVWAIADNDSALRSKSRELLAWEKIKEEESRLQLDDSQKIQVRENIQRAERDLKESVWWSYKNLALLGKDNNLMLIDLGKINPSMSDSLVGLYMSHLRQKDLITDRVSPTFLARNWPASEEWSTKAVRDTFFASPLFPRLFSQEAVKELISKGVSYGIFAYVGKSAEGRYSPFHSKEDLPLDNIEIADDMYIVKEPVKQRSAEPETIIVSPGHASLNPSGEIQFSARALDKLGNEISDAKIEWNATGGSINQLGNFKASAEEGTFKVTASLGRAQGSAIITVVNEVRKAVRLAIYPSDARMSPGKTQPFFAKGFDQYGNEVPLDHIEWASIGGEISDQGVFQAGLEEGNFIVTATAGEIKSTSKGIIKKVKAHWSGEMPHQKWSQFYTRVLMKHVVGNKLRLTIDLALSDITDDDIEQMRIALKELGLEDQIDLI